MFSAGTTTKKKKATRRAGRYIIRRRRGYLPNVRDRWKQPKMGKNLLYAFRRPFIPRTSTTVPLLPTTNVDIDLARSATMVLIYIQR